MTVVRPDNRLTHSRIQTAKTCLRKHYILYELALRPEREAAPLRIGRVFHRGMELATDMDNDEAILTAVADYDAGPPAEMDEQQQHAWWVERETVARLMSGHFWRWQQMNAETKVVGTEDAFQVAILNPRTGRASRTWALAGKRDKVVRLPDGRLAILEYKTTSEDISPDSDFWKRLFLDSQVSIYWLAAQSDGFDVQTILYDVTRKPSIRPRQMPQTDDQGLKIVVNTRGERILKADGTPRQTALKEAEYILLSRIETPEEFGCRLTEDMAARPDWYFARREIPRLEADLDEARYELWAWGKIIRDCQRHGRWPRNTAACIGFGRCPCWDLCTGGFELTSDRVPEGWKRVEDVHQELVPTGPEEGGPHV